MADLRYPADLQIDKETDYFQLTVKKYDSKDPTNSGAGSGTTPGAGNLSLITGPTTTSIGTIIHLPMPSNIQDTNSVGWGEDKMNNLTAAVVTGATAAQGFDLSKPETWAATIQNAVSSASQTAGFKDTSEIQSLLVKYFAAEATNVLGGNVSIDQILARSSGSIFNPNVELLFNGVNLREFRFSFKMTPRDEDERDNIKSIIRTLKKYMAASKGGTGSNALYLKTPHVFDLQYRKGNNKHPFLNSFKDCALKDMSVNYTGENVYATYYDGTPVSLTMDLSFQELLPIYDEDYTEDLIGVGW